MEITALKEKTKKVLKTFEATPNGPLPDHSPPWISTTTINFQVTNIGVAFPLEGPLVDLEEKTSSVRAFLFSIRSLVFVSQRGESGYATMQGFSFQFVPRYVLHSVILILPDEDLVLANHDH